MELKHYRIRTSPDGEDKYITIDLKQNFDVLDILSLNINKTDFYKSFSSDYGVLIGRINVNGGFGVPNAKVSVFIPLTDEDAESDRITQLYPYTTVSDVNDNGTRYNLFTPKPDYLLGTFPTKQEVLDSDLVSDIYKKYYKYTTVTNDSGDYMIFGVPVGIHTVHVDIDLSDIGERSFGANDMITTGFPESSFNDDGRGYYTFRAKNDLSVLPQVVSMDMTVDVKPLWGSTEEEVGITRFDFNTNLTIKNYATLAFSMMFDPIYGGEKDSSKFGVYNNTPNGRSNRNNITGEIARLKPQVMYHNDGVVLGLPTIKVYREDDKGTLYEVEDFTLSTPSEYDEKGMFIIKLPCNDMRYVTDEYGNNIESLDGSGLGTSGSYVVDIVCDSIGNIENGGEYYNFRLSDKPFKFEARSVYTVAWETTRNRNGAYCLVNQFTFDNAIRESENGKSRDPFHMYFVALGSRQDQDVQYLPRVGDWMNGTLYFGRMGNDNRNNYHQGSVPEELKRQIGGKKYYNVKTTYVDITQVGQSLTNHDNYAFMGELNVGIWENKKPNLNNMKKILDRGTTIPIQNAFLFFNSAREGIGNNFKTYSREIF